MLSEKPSKHSSTLMAMRIEHQPESHRYVLIDGEAVVGEVEYVKAVEGVANVGVGGLGLHGPEAQEARRVALAKKAAAISAARMAAAEGTKA